MTTVDPAVYDGVRSLPEHRRVLEAVLGFFRKDPTAIGAWVSGSIARGNADGYSDIDVGVSFQDEAARRAMWSHRWEWPIAPWFHRFDADHVRPYFVIYFYEPSIKTDIALYVEDELPPPEGGPYGVAWDHTGHLADWATRQSDRSADWTLAVHEDERFWAWTYYCVRHVDRGEYYEVASELHWLRGIVEAWRARLAGHPAFSYRRAESHYDLGDLAETFPRPERKELKRALLRLIDLHELQREGIDADWQTTEATRARIRAMVEAL
jgi:Nucleotidyltransferase domain